MNLLSLHLELVNVACLVEVLLSADVLVRMHTIHLFTLNWRASSYASQLRIIYPITLYF